MRHPTSKTLKRLSIAGAIMALGCQPNPAATWSADRPASLTLRLDTRNLIPHEARAGGLTVQHVAADIKRLVIGVFDTDTGADPALVPYLGLEVRPGPIYATTAPSDYHAAIAGLNHSGIHHPGALDFGALGLSAAQKVDFQRYLYTTSTASIAAGDKIASFTGLRPGSSRYLAFAAAFNQSTNASDSHVIGLSQATVTVNGNLAGNQSNSVPLSLTLNRLVGTMTINLTIQDSTLLLNKASDITDLYVGALNENIPDGLQGLGYRYEGNATLAPETNEPAYFANLHDNLTADNELDWKRYCLRHYSSASSNMTLRLDNLPVDGASSRYVVFAIAYKSGTFIGGAQSADLTLNRGDALSQDLTLQLEDL